MGILKNNSNNNSSKTGRTNHAEKPVKIMSLEIESLWQKSFSTDGDLYVRYVKRRIWTAIGVQAEWKKRVNWAKLFIFIFANHSSESEVHFIIIIRIVGAVEDVCGFCGTRITRFNYYRANYSPGCRIDVTPPSVVGCSRARQFADTRCSFFRLLRHTAGRTERWSEINEPAVIDAWKFTALRQQQCHDVTHTTPLHVWQ